MRPLEFKMTSGAFFIGANTQVEVIIMRSAALREAEEFKARCIAYDTPRLESEVFPEGVNVTSDIPYMDDGAPEHLLDVYSTSSV